MRLTVRITDHWTCMLSCRKVTDSRGVVDAGPGGGLSRRR